jgi:hypothetical protein
MSPALTAAIAALRRQANTEINRITARSSNPTAPIPFNSFNQMLRLCDDLFRAADRENDDEHAPTRRAAAEASAAAARVDRQSDGLGSVPGLGGVASIDR